MKLPPSQAVALAVAAACPAAHAADDAASPDLAVAQATPTATTTATPAAAASTPAPQRIEITGARERLDAARNGLSPETGSTLYRFRAEDIANLLRPEQPCADSPGPG